MRWTAARIVLGVRQAGSCCPGGWWVYVLSLTIPGLAPAGYGLPVVLPFVPFFDFVVVLENGWM